MSQISGYRAALLARIRQVTDDLEWIMGEVGVNDLHQRPTIDDWSIHEHVAHVRDMDREVILPLLRWATIPDMLGPRPYSRKEWRERRYDDGEPVAMILGDIRRMREEEIAILEQIDAATWERYLPESGLGPVSCEWIAELVYRHALDHLQCVMALFQEQHIAARGRRQLQTAGASI